MEKKPEEQVEVKEKSRPKKKRRCLLHSALMPFIFFIFFSAIFYFFAYDIAVIKFADITDSRVVDIFSKYSIFAGAALSFLSMIVAYIVYLIIRKIKLARCVFTYPILAALMNLPWYLLARQLVYFENKYTDIAKGVIYYIGDPLLSTTKFVFALLLVWTVVLLLIKFFKKIFVKKNAVLASMFFLPFLLSGCVGTFNEWACSFFDNPDHCLQNAAVQDANPSGCEKIAGEDFADSGSNPPKDKCYLRIAENTGDLEACENIAGGMYSYTKEECYLSVGEKFANPDACLKLSGADREQCANSVGPKLYPGSVLEIDEQLAILEEELKNSPDEALQKQLDELKKRRDDYLSIMSDKNKSDYESLSDPMNKKTSMDFYSGKIDEKTKNAMIALNDRLREQGDKLSEKEYKSLSEMMAYKNDPKNNIENMDPTEIVKLRWDEKVGNAVDYLKFWNANATPKEKQLDEQLLFYQRMLERQEAIDKGLSEKQQDFDRNADKVKDYVKDKVWEKGMEIAKEQAFGEMLDLVNSSAEAPVTAILGEAIDTVKKEAKSAEFRGLVDAYNKGMEEELAKAGGDVEKAHAAVTANLQNDPYSYEDGNSFAKYGNILENKDCDGSNPHCIKRDVFWKAMKKSYEYQNK